MSKFNEKEITEVTSEYLKVQLHKFLDKQYVFKGANIGTFRYCEFSRFVWNVKKLINRIIGGQQYEYTLDDTVGDDLKWYHLFFGKANRSPRMSITNLLPDDLICIYLIPQKAEHVYTIQIGCWCKDRFYGVETSVMLSKEQVCLLNPSYQPQPVAEAV